MRTGKRKKRGRGKRRVRSHSPFSVWLGLKEGGAAGLSGCRAGWRGEGTEEKRGREGGCGSELGCHLYGVVPDRETERKEE